MTTPSPAVAVERSSALDAARFLAAAAIVWLHSLPINPAWSHVADLGRLAVPFFSLSAMVMIGETLRRAPQITIGQFAAKRFRRLYVPFLAWTAIYVLLRDLKCLATGQTLVPMGPHLLLVGSTHHLWFLPFLFSASIVFFLVLRSAVREGPSGAVIAAICAVAAAVVATLPCPCRFRPESTAFFDRLAYLGVLAWDALPATLLGVACARAFPMLRRIVGAHAWLAAVALGMLGIGLVSLVIRGRSIPIETSLGGMLFASSLGAWRGHLIQLFASMGRYAYGIYLTHVAFVLGIEAMLGRSRGTVSVWWLGLIFASALAASLLTTHALTRWRATRWLVL